MASPQPAHNVPAALLMLKQGHVTKVTGTHHPEKKLGLLSAFTRSQMIASTELCSTASTRGRLRPPGEEGGLSAVRAHRLDATVRRASPGWPARSPEAVCLPRTLATLGS